jgi:hypothetical protein
MAWCLQESTVAHLSALSLTPKLNEQWDKNQEPEARQASAGAAEPIDQDKIRY